MRYHVDLESTNVVRSDRVDFNDVLIEGRRLVNQKLYKVVRRRFTSEQLKFCVDGATPRDAYTDGNL
jgi:hypothetical protein